MPPLYPLIHHPVRPQPSPPPHPRGRQAEERGELRGLAIPEDSHTVHTSPKPKKQQTWCSVADRQKTETALVASKEEEKAG